MPRISMLPLDRKVDHVLQRRHIGPTERGDEAIQGHGRVEVVQNGNEAGFGRRSTICIAENSEVAS